MKKKKFIILLPLFALLLLGAACQKKTKEPAVEQKTETGQAVSGSMTDLLKLGKNSRCELVAKEDEQVIAGTNYIAEGKTRSDFQMKILNKTVNSHSIIASGWMYSWIDEMPIAATKIKIADLQKNQTEAEKDSENLKNYNAKYNYQCFPWSPDESKFVPPAGIDFKDLTAIFTQIKTQLPANNNACASCNLISDAKTKEMCRQSLKCK